MNFMMKRVAAVLLVLVLFAGIAASAEGQVGSQEDWFTFFLMCNEGMRNEGDNVGNTMMIVSANPVEGRLKLLMFTWDSFVDYPGYDLPQLIDQPFRVAGPEETMKVFNSNFGLDVESFLSVNYLSLASLIDAYGGVDVDITRAERNALNGMVEQKANMLLTKYADDLLMGLAVEIAQDQYYLDEYGYGVHLNGLQSVAFGWLQYDSIYNCCKREVKVIKKLFSSVATASREKVIFFDDAHPVPDAVGDDRRRIDLDNMSPDDEEYVYQLIAPIFEKSYHNVSREDAMRVCLAIINTAYEAERSGIDLFDRVEVKILPLEVLNAYDTVAGKKGHLIDKDANREAIMGFLYGDDTGDKLED